MKRRSSATWLALCYAVMEVYASLYPFWPWRMPPEKRDCRRSYSAW